MGNLQLNKNYISSKGPHSRKSIFESNINIQYELESTRTPKYQQSSIKKNTKINSYRKSNKSNTQHFTNKVYINSSMIKSVIKNCQRKRYSISPCVLAEKKKNTLHTYSCFDFVKGFQEGKSGEKQKSVERSLQLKRENLEKVAEQKRYPRKPTHQEQYLHFEEQPNQFPLQNKQIGYKYNKIIKMGNNTERSLKQNNCVYCCHQDEPRRNQFSVRPGTEMEEQMYYALTERKKPGAVRNTFKRGVHQESNRYCQHKFDIPEHLGSDTIKTNKENNGNFHDHRVNRVKCQEIIKKVRNFNEFLNEVKKKIKLEMDGNSSQAISTISIPEQQNIVEPPPNNPINIIPSQSTIKCNSDPKSITMALRLQNQKIELQKYKKLVQRQLSKQHSIESIDIESGKKNQKIITINFDKKHEKDSVDRQRKKLETYQQRQMIKKDKIDNCQHLMEGSYLKSYRDEQGQQQIKKRVSKISILMNRLEGIQKCQNQSYRQICEILNRQSSGLQSQEELG